MARRVSAIRYAQAAFQIAGDKNELDVWRRDLKRVARLGEDAEIRAFLEEPKIRFEDKAKLLAEQLVELNPLVLNLTYLLITKGRFNFIGDISDEFERLLSSYRGIEQAEVTTAVPLSDEAKNRLKRRLGALVAKKIVLKTRVDPSLVSGMVARIGDRLLDGSTRSGLAALRRELRQGRI